MAFRLIKLISSETIIADAYQYNLRDDNDLFTQGAEIIQIEEGISSKSQTLLLIDPVELIIERINGTTETSLSLYLQYADDNVMPISKDRIIVMATPNTLILKSYCDYISQYKGKKELAQNLKEKNYTSNKTDELVRAMSNLDPKKDVEQ